MRPEDLLALSWTLYRLQLSAARTAAAWWWAAMSELWLPRKVARRPGPSLAEMARETRRDTFESDEGGAGVSDEREQKVAEVVQKFRDLGSGPAGGVRVSLPGAPDALPVYEGGARAFTPAAVAILSELWELTEYPEGQRILIEAHKRWQEEDEYEGRM